MKTALEKLQETVREWRINAVIFLPLGECADAIEPLCKRLAEEQAAWVWQVEDLGKQLKRSIETQAKMAHETQAMVAAAYQAAVNRAYDFIGAMRKTETDGDAICAQLLDELKALAFSDSRAALAMLLREARKQAFNAGADWMAEAIPGVAKRTRQEALESAAAQGENDAK